MNFHRRWTAVVCLLFSSFFLTSNVRGAGPALTTTTLGVSAATTPAGRPLQLTARVMSDTHAPSGKVSFYDGSTLLGTSALNQLELAGISVSTLQPGLHTLTAVYAGGTAFAGSTSDPVTTVVVSPPAGSKTIKVPGQYHTIQAAINAAKEGDTVLVAAGVYKENIDFKGKDIVLTSQYGAEKTILDGKGKGTVVRFQDTNTLASVLNGFTVRNGADSQPSSSGGIVVSGGAATITSNLITGNAGCGITVLGGSAFIADNTITDTRSGGGYCAAIASNVALQGTGTNASITLLRNTIGDSSLTGIGTWAVGTVLIENNIIRNNGSGGVGGVNDGTLVLVGNLIVGNMGADAVLGLSSSGGVYLSRPAVLVNNTITGNSTGPGSAKNLAGPQVDIAYFDDSEFFANNIVVGVDDGPAVQCDMPSMPSNTSGLFRNNDVFSAAGSGFGGGCKSETGKNGNISLDPMFVNAAGPDYSLLKGSPAIDAGSNLAPNLPVFDIAGQPRILAGASGKLTVDMGAFEYAGLTKTSVSPASLAFADQTVFSTSGAKTVKLTNAGKAPLHIASIVASGQFAETDSCETTLGIAPGSSCVISTVFVPVTRGAKAGAITIRGNSASGPLTVHLTGTATGAVAGLAPPSLTFASQQLSTSSAAEHVTLSNTGDAVLTITSVAASGDFAASAPCKTVAPGKSCVINVTFKPTARGHRTGTLTIADNATVRTQTAALAGTGIGADITLSADQLAFTGIPVNVTSPAQTLTVTNHGESTLTLKYAVSGPFAANGTCGATLPAGQSCALQVTFTPVVSGSSSGGIAFTDNAAGSPQVVTLSGTAGTPNLQIYPTQLVFPGQIASAEASVDEVYLENYASTAYLLVSNISVTAPFTQTNDCNGTVAVNTYCTVKVSFPGGATGTVTGTLTLTDSAPGGTQTVPITVNIVSTHSVPTITSTFPAALPVGGSQFDLEITGTNFFSDTVLMWNGTPVATTVYSPTSLSAPIPASLLTAPGEATVTAVNPAPGGGTSNAIKVPVFAKVLVSARDMVWDPLRKLIYLSTDTNSIVHANQVLSFDPATAKFGPALLSGNTPGKLAITADGKYLYAETDKNGSVTRIDLSTGKSDLTFKLAPGGSTPQIALDIAPVPGDDSSVAITLGRPQVSPSADGITIFTDGKPAESVATGFGSEADALLYLNGTKTLYASDTEVTPGSLFAYTIGAGSISLKNEYSGFGGGQLATDGKNIFVGNGQVISPVNFSRLALLPFGTLGGGFENAVTVNSAAGEAYFGANYGQVGLYVVSTSTFKVLGQLNANNLDPTTYPTIDHIIRYGTHEIAFRSSASKLTAPGNGNARDGIYLLQTSLVN